MKNLERRKAKKSTGARQIVNGREQALLDRGANLGAVISCRGIRYEYKSSHWQLHDVDIDLAPGEVLALKGPNGSGKSTLIKILATILRPRSGTLKLFNLECNQYSKMVRQKLAYVPQRTALADGLSASENLMLAASFYGLSPSKAKRRVNELLDVFALRDLEKKTVGELSGGQFRRVALARAVVGDPQMLLLDEPTSGMDASSRGGCHRFLKALSKEAGVSIVLASHDEMEVAALADTCLSLENGRIVHVTMGMKHSRESRDPKEVVQHVTVRFLREVPPGVLDHFCRLVPRVRSLDQHTLEIGLTREASMNELLTILGSAAPIVSVGTCAASAT